MKVDLTVEIAGIKFRNPIVVGSATPTMNARGMKKGIDGGAGAVIAKSLFGEGGKLGGNPAAPLQVVRLSGLSRGIPRSCPTASPSARSRNAPVSITKPT